MSESAEAIAAQLGSRRNVTIEITNNTTNYVLIDPEIHMDSGHCHIPPTPTLAPSSTELCNFSKTSAKTSGAVGVLAYNVVEMRSNREMAKLAIMFSVPYDRNVYKNWFGFGVFSTETEVNKAMFEMMYYKESEKEYARLEGTGSNLTFQHPALDIMGTMSPLGKSIMKVEIWEKLFHPAISQSPY
ncbi:DELTA-stichotoxin-Hcr4a-like [Xyrichtys novacula]|uniref:DELTA-stichotoxin-Hcr4a-like n=1 Tax=Xyrichtys novacula TaxID=13765 RepID=A0AAV1H6B4_XYRNO|nr:DELTA-stichotoxin-Hcr4a-like [Xyrichtys novacula]